MLDISKQAVLETAAIHIKGADGAYLYDEAGNPARIHVYGPGTKAFAAVEARQTQRALKRREDNDGKITPPSPEQRRKEDAEDLATVTVEFENFEYPPAGDKKGAELFEALYLDPKLGFIAQQVAKFVGNWSGFKPGSVSS